MPIYEYKCNRCSRKFEEFLHPLQIEQMKKKGINPPCPVCGNDKTEKVMSTPNFQVKGYNEANGYSNGGVK